MIADRTDPPPEYVAEPTKTAAAKRWSSVVQLGDELLGSDCPEGVFDNGGDLVPINAVLTCCVEVHPEPAREGSRRRDGRLEEPLGFGAYQLLWHTGGSRAPQRDPFIAVVMVVVIAQRAPVANKETRGAVATSLADLRQR